MMRKHRSLTLATVTILAALAGIGLLSRWCGGETEQPQENPLPAAVEEAAKDADFVFAVVPKVEEDGHAVRLWVMELRRDSKTGSLTTAGTIATNVIVHDCDTAYFTYSSKAASGTRLQIAGIRKFKP